MDVDILGLINVLVADGGRSGLLFAIVSLVGEAITDKCVQMCGGVKAMSTMIRTGFL